MIRKLKHEIGGKAQGVSFYGLIQHPGINSVQLRQISIQHDSLFAEDEDRKLSSGTRKYGLVHSTTSLYPLPADV